MFCEESQKSILRVLNDLRLSNKTSNELLDVHVCFRGVEFPCNLNITGEENHFLAIIRSVKEERKQKELLEEKKKQSEHLLLNIFPEKIAEKVKQQVEEDDFEGSGSEEEDEGKEKSITLKKRPQESDDEEGETDDEEESDDEEEEETPKKKHRKKPSPVTPSTPSTPKKKKIFGKKKRKVEEEDDDTSGEEDGEEEDDDDGPNTPSNKVNANLLYNAQQYMNLPVDREVKDLFTQILDYKAVNIELDTKLMPFIPDYIPAVGELDPFIKPPKPDGGEEKLGLKVMDEPCLELSNPTIVKKMIRITSKKVHKKKEVDVEHLPVREMKIFRKKLQNWINETEQKLHKKKPTSNVTFTHDMPDLTQLMGTHPDEYDDMLHHVKLPSGNIDLSLEEYAKVIKGTGLHV